MIYIGKIVSTHGIKGELRIISDFEYKDINEVLFLLKSKVYFKEEDLKLNDNEILDSELLKYTVESTDNRTGKVVEIFFASQNNKVIRVMLDKEYLIPYNSPMLVKIDKDNKKIIVDIIEGM